MSQAHLVLKFVREVQYQGMKVSCSRWASRMNLINSPQQQNLIIRWCCLRPSLVLELDNLNWVASSGFLFCHVARTVCADGMGRFSVGLYMSSVERVKNYEWIHWTVFCFQMIGTSTRFSDIASMEGAEASGFLCCLCH